MAYDKLVDSAALDAALKASADAIRGKTGDTASIPWDANKGFAEAIAGIQAGGGGEEEWFNDGDTHIWITLGEGRTSPVLGVGVNGTVTVDWGDGGTPDVLTGTNIGTTKYTPSHVYATAGDYIIRLTVDGEIKFQTNSYSSSKESTLLQYSDKSSDIDKAYRIAIKRIEVGNGVTGITDGSFTGLTSLTSVVIPDDVTSIGSKAFSGCTSLPYVVIPNGVTSIGAYAFRGCSSLSSFTIPDSVTSIGLYAFNGCSALTSVVIPDGVTIIDSNTFANCLALTSVTIPDSVTSIGLRAFDGCSALVSAVIPEGVTNIDNYAFNTCSILLYCDFSKHTAVPALGGTKAFYGIPSDCEIRVPAALYDEWIAATNWSTFASNIVAV